MFEEQLGKWGVLSAGLNYHTVAILGGQSSGKSASFCVCIYDVMCRFHRLLLVVWLLGVVLAAASGSVPL
jgi:hypothetical protein